MSYQDYYNRLVKLSEVLLPLFNYHEELGDINFYGLLNKVYNIYKKEKLDQFPAEAAMEYYSAEMVKYIDNKAFLENWIERHRQWFITKFFAFTDDAFSEEMKSPISKEIGGTVQWLLVEFCNILVAHGKGKYILNFPNVVGFPTMAEELHYNSDKDENIIPIGVQELFRNNDDLANDFLQECIKNPKPQDVAYLYKKLEKQGKVVKHDDRRGNVKTLFDWLKPHRGISCKDDGYFSQKFR